ncbi:MAG TPA: hypothetical protein VLB67_07370, partial [Acidimicrobiia bacterium]|nr:hypothetical protein [Acidimicrobiia bacterium]
RFTHVAAGWAALLGTSVAGMAIVMQVTGDPGATTANTVAFGAFALIALVMAWLVYRPMLRAPSGGEASPGRHASRSDR